MRFKQIAEKIYWILSISKFYFLTQKRNLSIVTAASPTHFKSLINLLNSLEKFEKSSDIYVYGLNLTPEQILFVESEFKNVNFRKFDFSKFPEHFNIEVNAGDYAWKPLIIKEVCNEVDSLVLWLDAGDVITKRLAWIRKITNKLGFFSPFSGGKVLEWTHPEMIKRFDLKNEFLTKPNLNGAIICFDSKNQKATYLLELWVECAMSKECIAPLGSNSANHRQDQAALTCLAYLNQMAPKGFYAWDPARIKIKIHQDVD